MDWITLSDYNKQIYYIEYINYISPFNVKFNYNRIDADFKGHFRYNTEKNTRLYTMTFTKEQLQQLKQYESHFNTSLYQETLRSATRLETERIKTIYESATGSIVTQSMSCGSCKLRFYKTVAKLYYADLEELDKPADEELKEEPKKTKKSSKKNAKVNES